MVDECAVTTISLPKFLTASRSFALLAKVNFSVAVPRSFYLPAASIFEPTVLHVDRADLAIANEPVGE